MSDEALEPGSTPRCGNCPFRCPKTKECRRARPEHDTESGWKAVDDDAWCGEHPMIMSIYHQKLESTRGAAFLDSYLEQIKDKFGVDPFQEPQK